MGKLEGPHRRVTEVSGVGCFGRVMGLKLLVAGKEHLKSWERVLQWMGKWARKKDPMWGIHTNQL